MIDSIRWCTPGCDPRLAVPLDEPDHASDEQLGGDEKPRRARRSDRLYVLQLVDRREDADVVLTNKVPARRSLCPTKRPCGHVRCTMNLSYVEADARPGRRHPAGNKRKPTLEFVVDAWTNCALDVAESENETDFREIAKLLGTTQRRMQQVAKGALEKLGIPEKNIAELLEDPIDRDRRIDYGWVNRKCES